MTLPLLLNENFPAPSVLLLQQEGIDLVSISHTYPGIADEDVLAMAVSEGRCIVTFDHDYGELLFARRHPAPPAVILLRMASYRPEEPAQLVKRLIADEQECLGRLQ